ncbi:MAG: alpha-hydroxy acid oxidase [Actinomycetota bacterium]
MSGAPWERRAAALASVPTGPDGLPRTLADYEAVFAEILPEATHGYYAGGGADEITLRGNVEAWRSLMLWPRVLRGVDAVDTSCTVLGRRLAHPFLVGPTAFHGLADAEAEVATARGARDADALYVLSTLAHTGPRGLADGVPDVARWFQLYVLRDRGLTRAIVDEAAACGFEAIVVTVDLPPAGRRERELRTGFTLGGDLAVPSIASTGTTEPITMFDLPRLFDPSLTWDDLAEVATWTDLPLVVKGVLHPDDARLAVEHGLAAVVVSNHGGRQLDTAPATAVALPRCAEAVAGRVPLLVDGGIRRGTDAVKARALGADAVLVGRPALYGLAAAGSQGVTAVLRLLVEELRNALALLGAARFEDVTSSALRAD